VRVSRKHHQKRIPVVSLRTRKRKKEASQESSKKGLDHRTHCSSYDLRDYEISKLHTARIQPRPPANTTMNSSKANPAMNAPPAAVASKEYLAKLNSELPTNANDLYQLAILNLKHGTLPPLGDDTSPTVSVIADTSVFSSGSRFGGFYWIRKKDGGWNSESCVADITELACRDMDAVTSDAPEDSIENHVLAVWIPQDAKAEIHLGESNIERSIHDIAVQGLLRQIKFKLFSSVFMDDDDDDDDDDKRHTSDIKTIVKTIFKKNVKEMLSSTESQFPSDESNKGAVLAHFSTPKKRKEASNESTGDATETTVVHVHSFDRVFAGISDSELAAAFDSILYRNGRSNCVLCPNGDIEISYGKDGNLWVKWLNMYCG
jgi:hypothetical protein